MFVSFVLGVLILIPDTNVEEKVGAAVMIHHGTFKMHQEAKMKMNSWRSFSMKIVDQQKHFGLIRTSFWATSQHEREFNFF